MESMFQCSGAGELEVRVENEEVAEEVSFETIETIR
jgi:hypothetical protein